MNQELLIKIKNKIDKLDSEKILSNADIYLFGMNTPGDRVIQYLNTKGYRVKAILDNNKKNHEKTLMKVPVCNPNILNSEISKKIIILICSKYYLEMKNQLEKMGFQENKHIFKLVDLNYDNLNSLKKENLDKLMCQLYKANSIYYRIIENYNSETFFLLCPIRANGDIYISASLLEVFRKKNDLKKVVLIIIGEVGKKIASMFGIKDVISISQTEMEFIIVLNRFLGHSVTRMITIHPEEFHFNIFSNLECFNKLNFMDFIASGMLNLKITQNEIRPLEYKFNLQDSQSNILNKNSIILAPYANSLPCFPIEFWEKLVKTLNQKNYCLYTNSGNNMEPPILGTKPIFLPINEINNVLEKCAGFIGIRNGLCEVISSAKCCKIILYPEKGMGFGDVKEFYSLINMGLCQDAKEIIYTEGQDDNVIKEILEYVNISI